ncbi:ras-related protein Rap-2a-like [Ostrea edulis]|uniref:ras-related protein Rap-2a-like n=1 Tax=Ostrea edulis TaxID=37623 RepID=UPI0024AFAE7F|nr:ras-related protein Rap-2a-like [Ostrea edulis]
MRMQREIPHRVSDAFVLMYSLEDRRSLCSIAQVVRRIRNKHKSNSPIFLVANKMDLVRNDSVAQGDGKFLAREYGCKYLETSLLEKTDLDTLLVAITKQLFVKDAI